MKKLLSILLIGSLMISLSADVWASDASADKVQTYALNSYTGKRLENIQGLKIEQNQLEFEYSGKQFCFAINELKVDTSDGKNIAGAKFFSGKRDDLICNVVEYNGMYCFQVFNMEKSAIGRKNDVSENFTIISGTNLVSKIDSISSAIATANIQMESANTTRSALRVYVSGLTIPFLLSGGSAEGWCNATIRESNKYQISSLRYSVAYNWPSDGVSLWYDYQNSVQAYHSPAWPSSALTNVSGTWTVNGYTAAFMAEATISALVKGAPIMWTLYDVSFMDGSHE